MGEVLPFTLREQDRRLCFNCTHALVGQKGVYCTMFEENIWQEKVAEICEEWLL